MLILAFAGAAFAVVLVIGRRWHDLNSNDMGTMSQQWLVEYNAQNSDR